MDRIVSHDSETPAAGQQVLTATAFIHQDFDGVPKVLLTQRAATKKFYPNVWEMPGGHVDFGEDMAEGLKREIKEELEVAISIGDPFYEFTYQNDIKGSHSIEVVYFAKLADPEASVNIQPEDHSRYGWFSADELDKVMNTGRETWDVKETRAAQRGFELLAGQPLNLG